MSKASSYVCICEESVEDDLIADYTASGVKETGMQYGVLFGTREIGTVLLIRTKGETVIRQLADEVPVAD